MSGELGKATYELDADLGPLRRAMAEGERSVGGMERSLDALTAVSEIAEEALKQIKITAKQAGESDASAEAILAGVRGISDESREAARELDRVRISETQATESAIAGERIKHDVKDIGDEADRTKRKLTEVKLAAGRNGAGLGPIGSGYGRIGLLGSLIGAGVLTAPAAGPAGLGLLGATGVLGGGALLGGAGTLALAMGGVMKAIEGDKKAFQGLNPEAQKFVTTVRSLDGFVTKLKTEAAAGLFPGLEKGLREALDPATIGAIERAIGQMSHAIGNAGEEWGRYFGSPEFQRTFTTLMDEGARDITLLSHSLLQLFDSLGVLLRAGVPFTEWMMHGIDEATRLADAWMHQKERTGELAHAYDEAETSLRLVVGLLGGMIHVVESLGSALYPVSKVAVKDLTDGLNWLAQLIDRNKQAIRDIVGTALTGLKTGVEGIVIGIRFLNGLLERFVGDKAGVVTAALAIGAAITLALGPEAAAIVGVLLAVGLIRKHWDQLADYIRIAADKLTLWILEPFSHLPGKLGEWARTAKEQVEAELQGAKDDLARIGAESGQAWGQAFSQNAATYLQVGDQAPPGYKPGSYGSQPSTRTNPGGFTPIPDKIPNASYTQDQVRKLLLANGVPADVATNLAIISAHGEDPSGSPYALNDNPSTGDYSVGLFQENFLGQMGVDRVRKFAPQFGLNGNMNVKAFVDWLGKHPSAQAQIAYQIFQSQGYGAWTTAAKLGITGGGPSTTDPWGSMPDWTKNTGPKPSAIPSMVTDLLNKASENASKSKQLGNAGGTAKRYLQSELADLQAADKALESKLKSAKGKDATTIKHTITSIENKIRDVQTKIKNSLLVTGSALLTDTLESRLKATTAKFKADSTYAQALTGVAAENYASVLRGDILDKQDALQEAVATLKSKLKSATGRQKTEIQKELTKIQGQLTDVQQQVVGTLQQAVQILQSRVATFFGRVQTSLLTQLGAKYFQNGLKTPLEQQLADMQSADTKQSLQDAYDQAVKQLALDKQQADVTQDQLVADQKAIDQAQRAMDENDLAIRAAAERAQADADYARKSQELQDKLNDLTDSFQNGTATMDDLTSLAAGFGLTIDQVNTPAFSDLATATHDLQTAFDALKDYIEKLTGTRPGQGGDTTPTPPTDNAFGTMDPAIAAWLGIAPSTTAPDALARYLVGHAIPMADGGFGRAVGPTLFYSAGQEDFAFSGEGDSFDGIGAGGSGSSTHLHFHGGTFIGGNKQQVARDLKPYLERIITLTK